MKYGYYFFGNEVYSNELPQIGFYYFIEKDDKIIIYKRTKKTCRKIKEVDTYYEASFYNNEIDLENNFVLLNN